MTALTVDFTPNLAAQYFTTTWSGVPVQIYALWNPRGEFWACDITRLDTSEVLIRGLVLQCGFDLLAPYSFGLGALYGVNTVDTSNPTLASLGDGVRFYWVSP